MAWHLPKQSVVLTFLVVIAVQEARTSEPDTRAADGGASQVPSNPDEDPEIFRSLILKYFPPLPDTMPGSEEDTPERVALGKKLFFDTALSADRSVSCATCHRLGAGFAGTDGLAVSKGIEGKLGRRNAPSVLNAGYHFAQFWDARANTLEAQAKEPLFNPVEMGNSDEAAFVDVIEQHQAYPALFREAFPDSDPAISVDTVVAALAAFQRTLISKSRFDDFLAGKEELSPLEIRGIRTFVHFACHGCHNGPLLGGNAMQKIGVNHPYENEGDEGRKEVTGSPADQFFFKIPSLRNVALTAPYFHDGRVETLDEAVRKMVHLQLNTEISEEDLEALLAFLRTLSDKEIVASKDTEATIDPSENAATP